MGDSTTTQPTTLNVQALNISLQQAVVPLFWGALAAALLIPIAAAAGGWVAGKIDTKDGYD